MSNIERGILLDEVVGGVHDDILGLLTEAVHERRKIVAKRTARSFNRGDLVRITGGISPKYLIGTIVEVVGTPRSNSSKVPCLFPEDVGRFRSGSEVSVPAACLEATDMASSMDRGGVA